MRVNRSRVVSSPRTVVRTEATTKRPGLASTRWSAPSGRVNRAAVDGRAFCFEALASIKSRVARGEKVRVVFDIDDTLSESRVRTRQLARAWDAANGTKHFAKLSLNAVGKDGAETARAHGLSEELAAAFQKHWEVEFWKGESFAYDTPISATVKLAKQARAAGAEVVFLTGRVDSLQGATIAQLKRFGLKGVDKTTVVTKGDLTVRTPDFKTQWLKKSETEGHHLAFFLTESRRDVAAVQKGLSGAPAVLLTSSVGGEESVARGTPLFHR